MIQFVTNTQKPSVSQAHAYFMARDIWALEQDLFEERMYVRHTFDSACRRCFFLFLPFNFVWLVSILPVFQSFFLNGCFPILIILTDTALNKPQRIRSLPTVCAPVVAVVAVVVVVVVVARRLSDPSCSGSKKQYPHHWFSLKIRRLPWYHFYNTSLPAFVLTTTGFAAFAMVSWRVLH